jgi:hypothetical protein
VGPSEFRCAGSLKIVGCDHGLVTVFSPPITRTVNDDRNVLGAVQLVEAPNYPRLSPPTAIDERPQLGRAHRYLANKSAHELHVHPAWVVARPEGVLIDEIARIHMRGMYRPGLCPWAGLQEEQYARQDLGRQPAERGHGVQASLDLSILTRSLAEVRAYNDARHVDAGQRKLGEGERQRLIPVT